MLYKLLDFLFFLKGFIFNEFLFLPYRIPTNIVSFNKDNRHYDKKRIHTLLLRKTNI